MFFSVYYKTFTLISVIERSAPTDGDGWLCFVRRTATPASLSSILRNSKKTSALNLNCYNNVFKD